MPCDFGRSAICLCFNGQQCRMLTWLLSDAICSLHLHVSCAFSWERCSTRYNSRRFASNDGACVAPALFQSPPRDCQAPFSPAGLQHNCQGRCPISYTS